MDKLLFFEEDCDKILSEMEHQEKQMKLKRRWLLGLPLSSAESAHRGLRTSEFANGRYLSESLLRVDDVSYETIKSRVEKAFGLCDAEKECSVAKENEQSSGAPAVIRALHRRLDALTNRGLYLVAKILTRGSIEFIKTRPKMMEISRDYILKFYRDRELFCGQEDLLGQLSRVLSDPGNFRRNSITPMIHSHRAAAMKILDELESLPLEALMAMRRKLQSRQRLPDLRPPKSGRNRSHIVKQVREASLMTLLDSDEYDQMKEPLVKAMAVAELAFRLNPEHSSISGGYFCQFSTEIANLHNEIVKAIWLIRTKVRFPELKTLQLMLDPEAKVSNGSLRTASKKMLTEYLFECSDMDVIPKSLLEALAVVNRCSPTVVPKLFAREEVEEDVERILNCSAEMKQMVLDIFGNHDFDQDFTDAYEEELKDSDDDDDDDMDDLFCEDNYASVKVEHKNGLSRSSDSDFEGQDMGETIPVES